MAASGAVEPVLDERDLHLWEEVWVPAFVAHTRTKAFRRHLEQAKSIVESGLREAKSPEHFVMSVSAGKDSTALGELIAGEMGHKIAAVSEKDDLDYPGETEHLEALASRWSVPIKVVTPSVSMRAFIAEIAKSGAVADDDMHGRASALSKDHFYKLIEDACAPYSVVALGLRAEESEARRKNRMTRGVLYQKADTGRWHCCPLSDWKGIDVMAYCVSRGVPLLPLYKCIGFNPEHTKEPWRIRKSWWLPGSHSRFGAAAWLRRYYPSLWRVFLDIWPSARSLGG